MCVCVFRWTIHPNGNSFIVRTKFFDVIGSALFFRSTCLLHSRRLFSDVMFVFRFGWFMPQWTIKVIPLPDHWRSLQDPEIASLFDVDTQEMKRLAEFTKDPTTGRFVFLRNSRYNKRQFVYHSRVGTIAMLPIVTREYSILIIAASTSLETFLLVRSFWRNIQVLFLIVK